MDRIVTFASCLIAVIIIGCSGKKPVRTVVDFDGDWEFKLLVSNSPSRPADSGWRTLNVPHDWSIEGPFDERNPSGVGGGALPGGKGEYKKSFVLNDEYKGKRIVVEFDGVYRNSEVTINGHLLGKRPNGYISFHYDMTPFVKFGEPNEIVVDADNAEQPNSRWYSGSGIYRDVRLIISDPLFINHWESVITTPEVSASEAKSVYNVKLSNTAKTDRLVTVTTAFIDPANKEVGKVTTKTTVPHDSSIVITQEHKFTSPHLWSVTSPDRYTAVTTLEADGKVFDSYSLEFGLRFFSFDRDQGFSLNGSRMKLLGVCLHHDLGCLGAAFNERAMERQLQIMKDMGVNALRTTHNPPAPALLTLCDRMGIIVMDESFDIWKKAKNKFDYHVDWDQWHKRDLQDQILRDRNHPSVMIWSVGNEVGEQRDHADSSAAGITRELVSIVRNLDNTRPITAATDDVSDDNPLTHSRALDLVGYNYHHNYYEAFAKDHPGAKFIGTETTSALETRGHYDMPGDSIRRWPIRWDLPFLEGNPDNTVSAYDNVSAPWGSTHEETWKLIKKYPFLSGMFIWTGFDYIGEPTPYGWPSRSSYFGVVDLAGFPKDSYYLYQSEWTDKTVLHLFPHWNWKKGKTVDVWAYYNNADEVELFVNEKSAGIKKKINDDLHVMWRVPFDSGKIKAVSRKAGKEVLSREIKTAGAPARILVSADRTLIKGDGKDLTFVTIKILDAQGNIVPDAHVPLKFNVKGEGKLIGADNGDPTSHQSFQAPERNAFNGMCLVVIQSKKAKGKISLFVTSEGLRRGAVAIDVR